MSTPPMPVSANAPTKAVAVAITRLRSDATFDDALVFVHEMYTALNISTSMLIAALGLGQSLIMRWSDWRLGLAMGLSLVFKLTSDARFFVADLLGVPYIRRTYSLPALLSAEADAVEKSTLAHARLEARMVSFRKALLEVAMCEPRVHATNSPVVKWPRQLSAMTVEDDPQQMEPLVAMLRLSGVNVHKFSKADEALAFYTRRLHEPSKPPIDACFVDLNLDPEDSTGLLSHGEATGGLRLAESLADAHAATICQERDLPPITPLVVAVTARCKSAAQCSALLHRGIDAVVVKPMRLAMLRVLLEHVWS